MFHLIFAGLKFLIRLCSDLGIKEAAEYALELKKAEKTKEVRERIGSSRPGEQLSLLSEIQLVL
jgi:intraflagellar transport protein 88